MTSTGCGPLLRGSLRTTGLDLTGPTGSAGEIIDSPSNREFGITIQGERPDAPTLLDGVDPLERDGIRFGRALEEAGF